MAGYVPPTQIVVQNTDDVGTNGVKSLVYGKAGIGKTRLLSTAPYPIVLSAEQGLLSLRGYHLPFIAINSLADLQAAYSFIAGTQQGQQYHTIGLDSVSEIAEVVLTTELAGTKDPRKAYGEMATQIMQVLRAFRNLPRHVVFTAKQGRITDQSTGGLLWGPMMPGQQLDQQIPYMFDEVFQIVSVRNQTTGVDDRWLRTQPDNANEAKDRSGRLQPWEPPNLTAIYEKIMRA